MIPVLDLILKQLYYIPFHAKFVKQYGKMIVYGL